MSNTTNLNRQLFIADNLDLLRSLDNESVDLICIDPPFAKNQTFVGKLKPPVTPPELAYELKRLADEGIRTPTDAKSAGVEWPDAEVNEARFKDIWSWEDDIHEDWVNRIEDTNEPLAWTIEAARLAHDEGTASYLTYMAPRLIEMERVLKSTGSIYFHCDSTASHYIKAVMDSIFGMKNFRNEIIWAYTGPGSSKMRQFNRKHDTIFWYSKGKEWTFNRDAVRIPYKDPKQRPQKLWDAGNAFDPDEIEALRKRGKVPETWWTDIAVAVRSSIERTGYPTQKPIALAKRIIAASSNEGDLVLDCFAGCAYVPMAAEQLERRWIACDISPRAITVIRRQAKKVLSNFDVEAIDIRTANRLLVRTDEDPAPVIKMKPRAEPTYKKKAVMSNKAMLEFLLELSDYQAWCCGSANRMPDGSIVRVADNFHLDHLDPKSKKGSEEIWNRAPMCQKHNSRKSDKFIHLEEYRRQIAEAGELRVDSLDDLVDLAEAKEQVMEKWVEVKMRSGMKIE